MLGTKLYCVQFVGVCMSVCRCVGGDVTRSRKEEEALWNVCLMRCGGAIIVSC